MNVVGFSTGCMNGSKTISFDTIIKVFRDIGANAVELSFAYPNELDYTRLYHILDILKSYNYLAVHAPWKNVRYDSDKNSLIEKLRMMHTLLPKAGIIVHPENIGSLVELEKIDLPFLIENTKVNFGPRYFEKMRNDYGFGFVFDTQHAYRQDPSMGLAQEIISAMGDRLKHLHVSGCDEDGNHCPVHTAKNADAINKILEMKIDRPKIIEGILKGDILRVAYQELMHLESYER